MKCPVCGGDMVLKQRPEAAVGAGKPKGPEVGRVQYCNKCQKFIDELKKQEDGSQ